MKQLKIKALFFSTIILCLSSCLKKDAANIDIEDKTSTVMELQFIENGSGSTINSGMQYFAGGALTYPGSDDVDTATYNISLAGPVTLGGDLNVTVGVDATKVLDNFKSDSISYQLMPDSLYKIVETAAAIKAGTRIVPMHIIFYPSKIDVTKSYMLPLVIKEAGGHTISSNFGTIYFHVIGNPIAGAYTNEWIRYNTFDKIGTPAYDETDATVFAPVNPTTISVSDPTGIKYIFSFNNANGVLSNFQLKLDAASVTTAGITITAGPVIVVADPVAHKYEFNFNYNNSAGSPRNITDKFY